MVICLPIFVPLTESFLETPLITFQLHQEDKHSINMFIYH